MPCCPAVQDAARDHTADDREHREQNGANQGADQRNFTCSTVATRQAVYKRRHRVMYSQFLSAVKKEDEYITFPCHSRLESLANWATINQCNKLAVDDRRTAGCRLK